MANNNAPVGNWKARKRANLPLMTQRMMRVLQAMRAAKDADYPFVYLDNIHPRTVNALIRRGWIFQSEGKGLDRDRYCITQAGLKALKVYERPPERRWDRICPACGLRPKKVYPSGRLYGYCDECERKSKRRAYQLFGRRLDPDGLCARCKRRKRHQYPSGYIIPYCKTCRREKRAEERQRKHERLLQRIRNGEVLLCYRCKTQPRYHNETAVYDYCYDCYREYQNEYHRKRRQRRST